MLPAFVIVYVGSLALISALGGVLGLLVVGDLLMGFETWTFFLYTGFLAAMLTLVITYRFGYVKELGDSFLRVSAGEKFTLPQRVRLWLAFIFAFAGSLAFGFLLPSVFETQIVANLSSIAALGSLTVALFLFFYLISDEGGK